MDNFIGEQLKRARKAAKLNQEDIAEKLGLAKNTISDYETGKIRIPGNYLYKYAIACGTTLDELLDTGKKSPESMEAALEMLPGTIREAARIIGQLSQEDQERALQLLKVLKGR
jgi:transcriptional regulator with XRE-family HTH domain